MAENKIPLGRYMWERIHQIGVDTIFGVPGDFNLQFLDQIFHVDGLKWTGNQNELNASYAADGYARIKNVPGCFVTTHGVGELSALNGIAGSMSENVKVIHVVGQTTRAMQKNHMMIHHSIGSKPNHQVYNKASEGLRFAAAELWDIENAPSEIDRVLRECVIKSGPVYIFLPLDLSAELVDKSLLDKKIDLAPQVDEKAQEKAINAITSAIAEAKQPTVVVDALVHRFGAIKEAQQVVKKLNVPFFSTNMGKGIVDETEETFVGVWNGEVSTPGVKEVAKAADLVITLGYVPCDTNTAGFSRQLDEKKVIHINPFDVVVSPPTYQYLLSYLQHFGTNNEKKTGQGHILSVHLHTTAPRRSIRFSPLTSPTLNSQATAPSSTHPSGRRRQEPNAILALAHDGGLHQVRRRRRQRNRYLEPRNRRHHLPQRHYSHNANILRQHRFCDCSHAWCRSGKAGARGGEQA